ncbi:large ribosomal subunit protein uL16m [Antennarius striatus]|uniref:large ribosomal subunit protein uL16m n=1 Tax=Antennarius striatus TaxID=241820 RepID=UPI0035B27C6E
MISLTKAAVGGLTAVCSAVRHQGILHGHLKVLAAGMKTFDIPPDYSDVVMPERPKLKFMEKAPNVPKVRRQMKKLRDIQGPAKTDNTFTTGQYAIVAMGGGYLRWAHFEMIRAVMGRRLDYQKTFAFWRINSPYKPITRKSLGHRMGGGKGAVDHYVTPIRCGNFVLEVGGKVDFEEVERVMTQVARKLPFPAKAVSRESFEAMQKEHTDRIKNNENPWTFKKIVQGNMLGVRRVLSPLDFHNHGRYTGKFYFPERV